MWSRRARGTKAFARSAARPTPASRWEYVSEVIEMALCPSTFEATPISTRAVLESGRGGTQHVTLVFEPDGQTPTLVYQRTEMSGTRSMGLTATAGAPGAAVVFERVAHPATSAPSGSPHRSGA
jgi:hypothetical protein